MRYSVKHLKRHPLLRVAICLIGAVSCATGVAETTLRLSLQLPVNDPLGQNILAFERQVEGRTKGRVQIEIVDRARLYKGKQVAPAVAKGEVEMGAAPVSSLAKLVPAAGLFMQPFLFDHYGDVAKSLYPGHPIRMELDRALIATGVRVLWWQPYGMAVMLSQDQPLLDPGALNDRKVRVFSDPMKQFVESHGAKAIKVPGSKQYAAYATGEVDIGMTGVAAVKTRKIHEVMGHLTETNHVALVFAVVINEVKWQQLTPGEKKVVQKSARQSELVIWNYFSRIRAKNLQWIDRNTAMKVTRLSPVQRRRWKEASASALDKYARLSGDLGGRLLSSVDRIR